MLKYLGSWLWDQIRSLFFALDQSIYGVAESLYGFLIKLSTLQIFSESTIQAFATRIYALLGVIMIFKLTVSMVQYVAEPEKLESDGKKLVQGIIISLVLMVILPGIIFPLSRDLQNAILQDQLIEKIILGIDSSGNAGKDRKNTGRIATYATFSTFFYPTACKDMNVFVTSTSEDGSSQENSFTSECVDAINSAGGTEIEGFSDAYLQSYEQKDMSSLGAFINEKDGNGDYFFTYRLLVSTALGIFLAFMFFRFCFDIALRAVKLGFLQLIAPIPIISYADPKSKKVFDAYIKEYINTYLSLFIRLAALYFAITIIQLLTQNTMYYYDFDAGQDVPVNGFMMQLFIIIGALMFASEVPKLLEKLLGISAGSFSLNPFKNSPLAAGIAGGTIGSALSMGANVWGTHRARKDIKEKLDKGQIDRNEYRKQMRNTGGFGFAPLSYASNVFRGATGGFVRSATQSSKGNIAQGVNKGVTQTSQRRRQREAGYRFIPERVYDVATDMAQVEQKTGTTSVIKDRIKQAQQAKANYERDESAITRAMDQMTTTDFNKTASYRNAFSSVKDASGNIVMEKNTAGDDVVKLQYGSYNDYIKSQLKDKKQIDDIDAIMKDMTLTNEQKDKKIDSYLSGLTASDLDFATTIDRREYNAFKTLYDQREAADIAGKKKEKEIKRLQEMENLGKGKQ